MIILWIVIIASALIVSFVIGSFIYLKRQDRKRKRETTQFYDEINEALPNTYIESGPNDETITIHDDGIY